MVMPGCFILHERDTLPFMRVGNDTGWLARLERYTRKDLYTLHYEATIDDPGAYTAPWTIRWNITDRTPSKWSENGEMFEYICQDERQ